MSQEQPRAYRVRLMEGTRAALEGHEYLLVLDLTPGDGLTEAAARLDTLLVDLCREDRITGEKIRRYHLDVAEADGNDRFLWPASWLEGGPGR